MRRVLVCSAIPEEQEMLGWYVARDVQLVPLICGIGNVAAAVSLAEYLLSQTPDEILFVGSAGAYHSQSQESAGFRAVASNVFFQRDVSSIKGESSKPPLMPLVIETRRGPIAAGIAVRSGCEDGSVNCVDSVTLIPPGSEFEGLDFENMECFGLAWVAHKKNISFTAILAITNDVGPLGSDQWRANYRAYSRELQKRILNGLTSPDL